MPEDHDEGPELEFDPLGGETEDSDFEIPEPLGGMQVLS